MSYSEGHPSALTILSSILVLLEPSKREWLVII